MLSHLQFNEDGSGHGGLEEGEGKHGLEPVGVGGDEWGTACFRFRGNVG